jgi:hypothetical protein
MSFPPADVETRSFYLGMIYAFIEVVASGCKRLALSPPMTAEEMREVSESALAIAAEYGVLTHADDDCLETRLFNPAFTRNKHVLLFVADRATRDEVPRPRLRPTAQLQRGGRRRAVGEASILELSARAKGARKPVLRRPATSPLLSPCSAP